MTEELGVFETMYNCRAMRRIKPDSVDESLVVRLIEAAHRGPSAGNAQHDRWLVLTDPEKRKAMAELNRKAVDTSYPPFPAEGKKSAFQWQYENLEHIPVHVVARLLLPQIGDSFYAGVAAGGSIWGKVQNLLLAARAVGLGACPTTLPLQDRKAAREALDLPASVQPICLIPVGHPKGKFGPVTRRPVEEVIYWNEWLREE